MVMNEVTIDPPYQESDCHGNEKSREHIIKIVSIHNERELRPLTSHSKKTFFAVLLLNCAFFSFFAVEKGFACLQLITLILAISHSKQHFFFCC